MVLYLVTTSGNLEIHSKGDTEAQYSADQALRELEILNSLIQCHGTVPCNCTMVLYLNV